MRVVLVVLALCSALLAEVKQEIDLGFQSTKSNDTSSTSVFAAKYAYKNKFDATQVAFSAEAYGGRDDSMISDERYALTLELDHDIAKNWLTFADVKWLKDRVKLGLENKYDVGGGLGTYLVKSDTHVLLVKAGFSYVNNYYYDATQDSDFLGLTQALSYTYKFNDHNSFYSKFKILEDMDDISQSYEIEALAGLQFKIAKDIALKLEYAKDFLHTKTSLKYTDRTLVKINYLF
jgi:putative salt-induced outer membrane protein YdiY